MNLTTDQGQIEFVSLRQKSRRVDKVGATDRFQNIRHRDPCAQKFGGIGDDMKLRLLASLYNDCGNAIKTIESWFYLVGCHLPELGRRHGLRRQTVSHDRETGKGQTVGVDESYGWQSRLRTGHCSIDQLQGLEHVRVPV